MFAAAGLMDALHAPRADVTLFAPTDVAWLRAVGRVGDVLARAGRGPPGKRRSRRRARARRRRDQASDFDQRRGIVEIRGGDARHRVETDRDGIRDVRGNSKRRRSPRSVKFGAFFKRRRRRHEVRGDAGFVRGVRAEADARGGARAACGVSRRVVVACARHKSFRTILRSAPSRTSSRGSTPDAGRFADASAEDSAETSGVGDAANRESLASRAALGLDPRHAVVVLGDLFCANGVAHVVDAPLVPDDFFKTAPTGQDPPSGVTDAFFDAQSVPVFLQTPPPPAPAATSAPPPALMPVAAYFTAPPPPPESAAVFTGPPPSPPRTPGASSPPAPPGAAGTRGRARARAPDILRHVRLHLLRD